MKILLTKHDRFFNRDHFNGSYSCYGIAKSGSLLTLICDVAIDSLSESTISETRAHRNGRKARGKSLKPLRNDALHDEMVVVFGPEMSPRQALKALKTLQKSIKEYGLLVGRRRADGDLLFEQIA
jgi:hypothetical protein